MTIVALDSSSLAASCAIWKDTVLLGELFVNIGHTHSETLVPMLRSLLGIAGAGVDDVDLFAVSVGPGSFTGLRIGVATVKGLAMGAGKPCAPVSTLESLAENMAAFSGRIVPVMDARREQVYTASFHGDGEGIARLTGDAALSIPALRAALEEASEPVILVGDGARVCKAAMPGLDRARIAPPSLLHQRAASVAAIAARMDPALYVSAGELAPTYLRLPQAERERLARLDNRRV